MNCLRNTRADKARDFMKGTQEDSSRVKELQEECSAELPVSGFTVNQVDFQVVFGQSFLVQPRMDAKESSGGRWDHVVSHSPRPFPELSQLVVA